MIKLLVDMETAEKVSRKMEGVDQSVMFQGLIVVPMHLKEKTDGIRGIHVEKVKATMEEVAAAFQVLW